MAGEKIMKNTATEKMVKIHAIVVFAVCAAFGTISLISNETTSALITYALGVILPVVVFLMKNTTTTARGRFISTAQCFVIISISATKGELHDMFPLLLASMAMAGIYFDKTALIAHWIVADAATIIAVAFKDYAYVGAETELLLKGILGINVGSALLFYLVSCSVKFINSANTANKETDKLLDKVREQMTESAAASESQAAVVRDIADISYTLNKSSGDMRDVSLELNEAAENQNRTISEIFNDFEMISAAISESNTESTLSADAAQKNSEMIAENNLEMKHVVEAMSEINDSSKKIEGIIKTIEDIAFQTNILALNAAVEAARAGTAGKGFAVVADEVRSLANKSAAAASNTSVLIQTTMDSISKGTSLAQRTAERMNEVIAFSQKSASHAEVINNNLEKQTQLIESLKSKMEQVSKVVAESTQISVESSTLAQSVSEEAQKMNLIVNRSNIELSLY